MNQSWSHGLLRWLIIGCKEKPTIMPVWRLIVVHWQRNYFSTSLFSSSPERFTEHIETILHNLARENKNIFILGDFNINPLNCVSHSASENFLNMMNSNYLLPYILQLTRVTNRSATLIDNIFANTFNLSNFNALSGNLVTIWPFPTVSDHWRP